MSLRGWFLAFSGILLVLSSVLTALAVARRGEARQSRLLVENEWLESLMVLEAHSLMIDLHDLAADALLYETPLPSAARNKLEAAHSLTRRLHELASISTGGMSVSAEEMEAISVLQASHARMEQLLEGAVGRPVSSSRAALESLRTEAEHSIRAFGRFQSGIKDEVESALDDLRRREAELESTIVGCVLAVLGLLLAGWVAVALGVIRPILRLEHAARGIQAHRFDVPVTTSAVGELGALGRAFSEMAAEIRAFTTDLERMVRERTAELEASRAHLRFMLEQLPDAVALLRADGTVQVANAAYTGFFGDGRQPDSRDALPATEQGYRRLDLPDGRVRLLDVQRFRTETEGGGALEYARDVTRVAEAEAALAASQRLAAIGTLSTAVAHEINNPLTAIGAAAEGLIDRMNETGEGGVQREYLGMIVREVYRCKEVTDRLLNVLRRRTDARGEASIGSLAQECLLLARPLLQKRNVEADIEVAGDDTLQTVPDAVHGIILNLLMNASEACPPGGHVWVAVRGEGDRITVEVRDDGVGIPKSDLARIFEPFYTRRQSGAGTGLGLFICQSQAAALGGTLVASSDGPGKGASFRLVLPRAKPIP